LLINIASADSALCEMRFTVPNTKVRKQKKRGTVEPWNSSNQNAYTCLLFRYVYWRLYKIYQPESVKMLQLLCGRLNLCRLFHLRKSEIVIRKETFLTHRIMYC